MLFLVDGYNVTMADPTTCQLDKESQREALVRRLAARSRSLLGAGQVVVVFDARQQLGCTSEKVGPVTVVFAADADTEIVRRSAAAREQVTVVSNDRRLAARISQDVGRTVVYRKASVCFEQAPGTVGRKSRARTGGPDDDRPPDADTITRDLEAIWLPKTTSEEESE